MNGNLKRALALAGVLVALGLLILLDGVVTHAAPISVIRYVATTGVDHFSCTNPTDPCRTVVYALSMADSGDTIRVAAGTYVENPAVTESVTLEGGYSGPPNWVRDLDQYETALHSSNTTQPGDWDGQWVYQATVLNSGSEYEMWYLGYDMFGRGRLGRATGTPTSWTKSPENPLVEDARGTFVLLEGGLYRAWLGRSDACIHYAESADGLAWTESPNPVLCAPNDGSWESDWLGDPSLVMQGSTYWMFYEGANWSLPHPYQVGCATSPDGLTWTRCAANPVLSPGPAAWEENGVLDPAVALDGSTFKLWYAGYDSAWVGAIGYATSPDGVTWTKDAGNPVLSGTLSTWDEQGVYAPSVWHDGGGYHLWYSTPPGSGIGYASSINGTAWAKSSDPVLTPGGYGTWGDPVVRFQGGSDGAVIDGFTVTGGNSNVAGGIEAGSPNLTIQNCLIHDNWANGYGSAWAGGGIIGYGGTLTVQDSIIVNNQVNSGAGGVRVGTGPLIMSNVILADNHGSPAVHLNGPAQLMNVTVANNDGGVLINPPGSEFLSVINSIVYGGGSPIMLGGNSMAQISYSDIEGGWAGEGNLDANPWFVDPAGGDYHLQSWSPCIDSGTAAGAPDHDFEGDARPQNSGYDMGADEFVGTPIPGEGPRYVATTGSDENNPCLDPEEPCLTIAHGLWAANPDEAVRVAQGTYFETLAVDKAVMLEGGYSGPPDWVRSPEQYETILDGGGREAVGKGSRDGGGPARLEGPVVGFDGGGGAVLDGFTVTGGDGQGGIHVSAAATVAHCTVTDNRNDVWLGGGISVDNGASALIQHTEITGNISYAGGGLAVMNGSSVSLEESVVAENWTTGGGGGGIGLWGAVLTATGSLIRDNRAPTSGGMEMSDNSAAVLEDTQVLSNTAEQYDAGGIRVVMGSSLTFTDGSVEGNVAQGWGGGLWADGADVALEGTTIAGNLAHGWGGGLYAGSSTLTLEQVALVENHADQSWGAVGLGGTTATFTDVTMSGNVAQFEGGGGFAGNSTLTLTRVKISDNQALQAEAGGMCIDGVTAHLVDVTISGNSAPASCGGGFDVIGSQVTMENVRIQDNTAAWGAGLRIAAGGGGATVSGNRVWIQGNIAPSDSAWSVGGAALTLTNAVVTGNDGGAGGIWGGTLELTNVTVADNTRSDGNGGIYVSGGSAAHVRNSILVFNGTSDLQCDAGADCSVVYSDLEHPWAGQGNISEDPLFGEDYHLTLASPPRDSGTAENAPPDDMDGQARPFEPGTLDWDMGADEWWPTPALVLTPDTPLQQSGLPGSDVVYEFTLTNDGDYSDTFGMAVGGNAWPADLSADSTGELDPGQSASFQVTVHIPALGPEYVFGSDSYTLTATSTWPPYPAAELQGTTEAVADLAVSLALDDDSLSGLPGSAVVYNLTVKNTGEHADTYGLALSGDEAWQTTLSAAVVGPLEPGETAAVQVTVHVPPFGLEWVYGSDTFTVTATSGWTSEVSASASGTTQAVAQLGVTLIPAASSGAGQRGEMVTYVLTVTNAGEYVDDYTLTVASTWAASLSTLTIQDLAVGASATVTLFVTVPDDAMSGVWDVALVTIRSDTDPLSIAQATATTTAMGARIYLPVVLRGY